MKSNNNCRVELIPAHSIKRMPELQAGAALDGVKRARDFAKNRGYCNPVLVSDSDGCMNLLSGVAAYEVGLEGKAAKIPAVIVKTTGEADDLMFALQSAELSETLSPVVAGAFLVRLIDTHNFSRKNILATLKKSPAWLSRMESLSRSLNIEVQRLVQDGQLAARSAQEIARLPKDVQTAFAISACNDFLNKENVMYLVNRYLNEDVGSDERARIINAPKMALPNNVKPRGSVSKDKSISARLSHAFARCVDGNIYLYNMLKSADISSVAVRWMDVKVVIDSLADLHMRLLATFPPGENKAGVFDD